MYWRLQLIYLQTMHIVQIMKQLLRLHQNKARISTTLICQHFKLTAHFLKVSNHVKWAIHWPKTAMHRVNLIATSLFLIKVLVYSPFKQVVVRRNMIIKHSLWLYKWLLKFLWALLNLQLPLLLRINAGLQWLQVLISIKQLFYLIIELNHKFFSI